MTYQGGTPAPVYITGARNDSAAANELLIMQGFNAPAYTESKFGRNPDVDGAEDIWDGGGDYTGFPSGAAETISVFSSSANDTAAGTGARTVQLFGLDANFALQSETVTLTGVTPVATTKTWTRMFRARVVTAGSGRTNAGTITARHTTTTANVFMVMPIGMSQAQIAVYTIPADMTGYLKTFRASMLDQQANSAIMVLKMIEPGQAVRLLRPCTISTASRIDLALFGGLAVPEKTDMCLRALSVANANADITGSFELLLVPN